MEAAQVLERSPGSITFAVDDVDPPASALDEERASEALAAVLGTRVEACSSYTSRVVRARGMNPLVGAVHTAFSTHRPLVLSPDMIWLAVAQGVAQHVNADSERHRRRLVAHEGRETILVVDESESFHRGSPENPWPAVLDALARGVRARADPLAHDLVVASFTTTGPVERAAYQVTLLDMLRSYFDYQFFVGCGIPRVTLEGTVEDWADVRRRVEAVDGLGLELEWWTRRLAAIAGELERSSRGEADLGFWRRIYKLREAYGGETFSGWLGHLFPYIEDDLGRPVFKNPLFEDRGHQIRPDWVPCGLARAPLHVTFARDGKESFLELVAGFVGFEQDRATLALRPRIGWAVRPLDDLGRALCRLASVRGLAPPLPQNEVVRKLRDACGRAAPRDLVELYSACNGGVLRPRGARIFALDELVARDGTEERRSSPEIVFGDLATGEQLSYMKKTGEVAAVDSGRKRRVLSKGFAALIDALLPSARRASGRAG